MSGTNTLELIALPVVDPMKLPSRFQIGDSVRVAPGQKCKFDPLGRGGVATVENVTFYPGKVYYGVFGGMFDSCDVEPAA